MTDLNKVILVGRLGSEPEQRTTKNGVSVVHFSLATSHRTKDGKADPTNEEGVPQKETQWHKIVAWGRQGEACKQYLHKGHSVLVEGMMKTRKYTNKDGQSRSSFEVHANKVNFLGSPQQQTEQQMH